MAKIDFDKFLLSVMDNTEEIPESWKAALEDQGYRYNDGKLEPITEEAQGYNIGDTLRLKNNPDHEYKIVSVNGGIYGLDSKTYTDITGLNQFFEPADDKKIASFKKGDWIASNIRSSLVYQVLDCDYEMKTYILRSYHTDNTIPHTFSFVERNYHLWSLDDAKDGMIIRAVENEAKEKYEWVIIFKCLNGKQLFDYVSYCIGGSVYTQTNALTDFWGSTEQLEYAAPADKESMSLLFNKMNECGEVWNPITKRVVKIQNTKAVID